MKNIRKIISLIVLVVFLTTACSKPKEEVKNQQKTEEVSKKEDTRVFVDDLGRSVTLKSEINRVVPSGNPAQVMLHMFAPEKMVGISSKFSKSTEKFITDDMKELPVLGAFYGKKANLNMEELVKLNPDVVIDFGEKKKGIEKDLDALQEQIKIPVIFIELTLEKLPNSFERLSEVLGNKERGKELSDYIRKTYDEINTAKEKIKDVKKVYFAGGKNGLSANAKGSIHSDIIEFIGADNPIVVDKIKGGSGNDIPFEKLLEANPDILIFDSKDLAEQVKNDETFKTLDAVKSNNVFSTPVGPYSFFGRPPAVNRVIGMKWLANLTYPEIYSYDINKEIKEFYKLFYNYELKDDELNNILGN